MNCSKPPCVNELIWVIRFVLFNWILKASAMQKWCKQKNYHFQVNSLLAHNSQAAPICKTHLKETLGNYVGE